MTEATLLVTLSRTGPMWVVGIPAEQQTLWNEHAAYMDALVSGGHILLGGPLSDDSTVILAMSAASEEQVRALLREDPWWESHLVLRSVERWTARLQAPGLRRAE